MFINTHPVWFFELKTALTLFYDFVLCPFFMMLLCRDMNSQKLPSQVVLSSADGRDLYNHREARVQAEAAAAGSVCRAATLSQERARGVRPPT